MPSLAIVPAAGRAERFGRQKLLEDLGGGLGVTDPISGHAVVQFPTPAKARPKAKAKKKAAKSAKKAAKKPARKAAKKSKAKRGKRR